VCIKELDPCNIVSARGVDFLADDTGPYRVCEGCDGEERVIAPLGREGDNVGL